MTPTIGAHVDDDVLSPVVSDGELTRVPDFTVMAEVRMGTELLLGVLADEFVDIARDGWMLGELRQLLVDPRIRPVFVSTRHARQGIVRSFD